MVGVECTDTQELFQGSCTGSSPLHIRVLGGYPSRWRGAGGFQHRFSLRITGKQPHKLPVRGCEYSSPGVGDERGRGIECV